MKMPPKRRKEILRQQENERRENIKELEESYAKLKKLSDEGWDAPINLESISGWSLTIGKWQPGNSRNFNNGLI